MDAYELNGGEDHLIAAAANSDHGWQKVTYQKRQKKQKPVKAGVVASDAEEGNINVFRSLEERSEERRRRILEAQKEEEMANAAAPVRSRRRKDDDEGSENDEDSDDSAAEAGKDKPAGDEKKVKQKKPKRPKVTVAEAASKIDESDLYAFLANISGTYEGQEDIQLMRFADYFGTKFLAVSSANFPWIKLFRESPVTKLVDVPLTHISDPVYKTSTDWLNQRSVESLGSFVIWCVDSIVSDLAAQNHSSKTSKKGTQQAPSRSQVAIFVVLAMVLRRKPDALISVLSTLREDPKYQGQDKVPLLAWIATQVAQGDLAVGLYVWTHNLLPIVSGKNSNPQSRGIILQVVERILSGSKARTILVNGAVRRGERLVPPSAFDTLMRLTFPSSSARIKATERFEAIYPALKEVALAGSSGSKAMKQTANQIFNFAIKATGEGIPELSGEAAGVATWCLTENPDCLKQWDNLYLENLEASVSILKKLSDNWKNVSGKLAPTVSLRETLRSFWQKNEKETSSGGDYAKQTLLRESSKHCKTILGRVSPRHGCLKSMAFVAFALAVGAAVVSQPSEIIDFKSLYAILLSKLSP